MSRTGTGRAAKGGKGGQQSAEPARSRSFGRLLRKLRERHSLQASADAQGKSRGVSAAMLIEAMQQAGYPLSGAAYSEIENGVSFPRDATAFIDAVVTCLGLSEEEKLSLEAALAYDVVFARLGERAEAALAPEVTRQVSSKQPAVFGIVLRQCREHEALTPTELADRLIAAGLPPHVDNAGEGDRLGAVAWLATGIERIESAATYDAWPLQCSVQDFIACAARCLRRSFMVERRLVLAASLDAFAQM